MCCSQSGFLSRNVCVPQLDLKTYIGTIEYTETEEEEKDVKVLDLVKAGELAFSASLLQEHFLLHCASRANVCTPLMPCKAADATHGRTVLWLFALRFERLADFWLTNMLGQIIRLEQHGEGESICQVQACAGRAIYAADRHLLLQRREPVSYVLTRVCRWHY